MSEIMWLSLAFGRLAIRAEQLEQDNMSLRLELDKAKGIRPVESQPYAEQKEGEHA